MQDIKLTYDPETKVRDITIKNGDLESVDDMSTSIELSLLTDQRADSTEAPNPLQRRGWIGDLTPRTQGFQVGSKLWVYKDKRKTPEIISAIRDAAYKSLEWMLVGKKVERLAVDTEETEAGVRLKVDTTVGNNTTTRYYTLWDNIIERQL